MIYACSTDAPSRNSKHQRPPTRAFTCTRTSSHVRGRGLTDELDGRYHAMYGKANTIGTHVPARGACDPQEGLGTMQGQVSN